MKWPVTAKTTIFNDLTGARHHVGNYPAVTVEKKAGACRHGDVDINVVDLPDIYSLTAYSIEEPVARDFIVEEKPDVVGDIVDSSKLERNLIPAKPWPCVSPPRTAQREGQTAIIGLPLITPTPYRIVIDRRGFVQFQAMLVSCGIQYAKHVRE